MTNAKLSKAAQEKKAKENKSQVEKTQSTKMQPIKKPIAQNDNFVRIEKNKIQQYIEELNRVRGSFIANYARYEFELSKLINELSPIKHEISGFTLSASTSQKADALIKFVEAQKQNSKEIIDAVALIREVKKYEQLRNLLAHGVAEVLFDENANPNYVLRYYYQCANPKLETQIFGHEEIKKMTNDFKSLVKKIIK